MISTTIIRYKALPSGGMTGALWNAAIALNAAISFKVTDTAAELDELLWNAFPSRQAVLDFHAEHLKSSWPNSYGQSGVHHVAEVLDCFVNAYHLSQAGYFRAVQERRSAVLQSLVHRWGAPALKRRFSVGFDDAEKLWPRLHWAAKQAAILTDGEASSALVTWYRSPAHERRAKGVCNVAACEAVAHFGGVRELLRAAKRWRRHFAGTAPRVRPTDRRGWPAELKQRVAA